MMMAPALTPAAQAVRASYSMAQLANSLGVAIPNYRDDLCPLEDILSRIDRSNSWVYENGLVPMFDKNGQKVKSTKTPPWPWEALPDPIIKVGKKAWLNSSINQWILRMNARANQLAETTIRAVTHKEMIHD